MLMLYSAEVAENSEILFAELLHSLFSLDDKLNVARSRSVINYSYDMSIISMYVYVVPWLTAVCVSLNHNAPDPNLGGVKNQEKIYLFNGQHSVVETGAGPYLVVHMSMDSRVIT